MINFSVISSYKLLVKCFRIFNQESNLVFWDVAWRLIEGKSWVINWNNHFVIWNKPINFDNNNNIVPKHYEN